MMKLIFVCSLYTGDIEQNKLRARRYCRFAYEKKCAICTSYSQHRFLDEKIRMKEEKE